MLHFQLVLINSLNKTESAVFNLVGSPLYLKDSFFQILYRSQQLSLFLCGVCKTPPVHRYSVDIYFHILVLQQYWYSDRKQHAAYAGARGRENCCTFHYFSLTDSIKTSLLFSYLLVLSISEGSVFPFFFP